MVGLFLASYLSVAVCIRYVALRHATNTADVSILDVVIVASYINDVATHMDMLQTELVLPELKFTQYHLYSLLQMVRLPADFYLWYIFQYCLICLSCFIYFAEIIQYNYDRKIFVG